MGHNKRCILYEKYYEPETDSEPTRSKEDLIECIVDKMAEPLNDGRYAMLQRGVLTVISISDNFEGRDTNYRKTVKVEVIPNTKPLLQLTNALKRAGFREARLG